MQVERESGAIHEYSGVRVSNTWVIYLLVRNNPGKPGLIPHEPERGKSEDAESGAIHEYSGVRVSNTWVIYLLVRNNPGKPGLIPHEPERGKSEDAERGARGRLAPVSQGY